MSHAISPSQQLYQGASVRYHVTEDASEKVLQLIGDLETIGHQVVRGRDGKVIVMYETHWQDLLPRALGTTTRPLNDTIECDPTFNGARRAICWWYWTDRQEQRLPESKRYRLKHAPQRIASTAYASSPWATYALLSRGR